MNDNQKIVTDKSTTTQRWSKENDQRLMYEGHFNCEVPCRPPEPRTGLLHKGTLASVAVDSNITLGRAASLHAGGEGRISCRNEKKSERGTKITRRQRKIMIAHVRKRTWNNK